MTSVTVSLPSSKRASRRGSIDLGNGTITNGNGGTGSRQRSRRNSIDLYTADYNIKLICDNAEKKENGQHPPTQQLKMIQR